MQPHDLRSDRSDQLRVVEHTLNFREDEGGALIKQLATPVSIPVPRIDEWVLLSEETLTRLGDEVVLEPSIDLPEDGSLLYKVVDVAYEYSTLGPDESTSESHTTGISVHTSVRVREENTPKSYTTDSA